MSVEVLQSISIAAFIAAAALFLISVALFFIFDIPKTFGEISGSTAKKAIENIRRQNEQTGTKEYRPSPVNAERGKITDKISPSGKLLQKETPVGFSVGTEKLNTADLSQGEGVTTVLIAESNDSPAQSNCRDYGSDGTKKIFSVDTDISFLGSEELIR